ncbi:MULTISPECIES: nuclear transport factor 2 family protein [unclassified Streptomyces]|uniref:nuclear transport factor 2 family protein n=1 Tax=unclassified Streptomyces TaxID=2593676 RepID=UPI002E807705|nr:nuclear transport factor 2 family protein [Streptomyces sp. NBC_00589]WTI33600.1 nuclear transport factor 2 family protein [Streptomyces sp. NBC_00775]WUB32728.1 nuclear transport factor 2 family protein [Streptomyces sp. NBC_00589]
MTTLQDLAARLDRVETELALHRLAHDYCVGADHRDPVRWKAIWTADAVWETSSDQIFTGIEAIRAAVEQQWQAFPIMQHATANHTVEIDGAAATGRSDVVVLAQLRDHRWIAGGGTYEDEYRRKGGIWRIARRRVVRPFDLAPLAPSDGPVYVDEPVPANPGDADEPYQ